MSLQEEVNSALEKVRGAFPNTKITATVADKIVTLKGEAPDIATKGKVMNEFNKLVHTENTINQILIPKASDAPAPKVVSAPATPTTAAPAPGPLGRVHEVAKGDTLSAIAKKYYGNANQFTKIFDANRDQLKDPDKIRPGQKLRIPD